MQSGLLQLIMKDKNEVNRWAGQLQMSALTLNTVQCDCLILTFASKVISAFQNLCCYHIFKTHFALITQSLHMR